jgi:hypothetical protein
MVMSALARHREPLKVGDRVYRIARGAQSKCWLACFRLLPSLACGAPLRYSRQTGNLLTDALLLTGLRVKRDVATRIFRGIAMMEESDTYLMIIDQGKEKEAKRAILLFGEERLGSADESIKSKLDNVSDLERLERMIRRAAKATTWREILETP